MADNGVWDDEGNYVYPNGTYYDPQQYFHAADGTITHDPEGNVYVYPDADKPKKAEVGLDSKREQKIEKEPETKAGESKITKAINWITSAIIDTKSSDAKISSYIDNLLEAEIIGCERVKKMIKMITSQIETNRIRKAGLSGVLAERVTLEDYYHMILMGPKDTGKHLVGQCIAKILKKMKIISQKKFLHLTNTTIPKFVKQCEDAEGGVLFVEEAGDLFTNVKDKKAIEAIQTILREQKTTVIFSGSTEEMSNFISNFPSLAYYVPHVMKFDHYSVDELLDIFSHACKKEQQTIETGGTKPIRSMLKQLPEAKRNSLNAKIVTDLLDKAKFERDARLNDQDAQEYEALNYITVDDITRAMYLLDYRFEPDDQRTIDEMLDEEFSKVVGLEKIKNHLRQFASQIKLDRLREQEGAARGNKTKYHMVFSGPPGTGKTMIARLVGQVLLKLELVPSNTVKEIRKGADLKSNRGGSATVDAAVTAARGGILFVDEAYTMQGDSTGQEAVDSLMRHLDPPSCVMIFAGYQKQMDDFLLANDGLTRRIPYRFEFVSYSNEQLFEILQIYSKSKSQTIEATEQKGIMSVLTGIPKKFISKQNAGLIINWVDRAITERDSRLTYEMVQDQENRHLLYALTAADFEAAAMSLGYKMDNQVEGKSIEEFMEEEFKKIVGVEVIKKRLRSLAKRIAIDKLLEEELGESQRNEKELYHMVFYGNPGTGKSFIAAFISKLLAKLGVTQTARVTNVKNGLELVGSHVGETPGLVDARVKEAEGGVMVIDEAYSITQHTGADASVGAYGKECMDTLMKHMDPPQCVFIFAGYETEMKQFLRANSGLSRRTPYQFQFPNYSIDELLQIFQIVVKSKKLTLEDDVLKKTKIFLGQISTREMAQRNAGLIVQMTEKALTEHRSRLTIEEIKKDHSIASRLSSEDIRQGLITLGLLFESKNGGGPVGDAQSYMEAQFAKIVGNENLKTTLRQFAATVEMNALRAELKGESRDQSQRYHMVFKGPPGTGKTMWAKIVANILLRLQLVPSDKIVTVGNPLELQGQYVGHSGPKVDEKVAEARGGILFIDEAYSLKAGNAGGHDFAKEVIDTIMKHLDPPQCVFIFAGYEEQMNEFLATNEGIASRVPYTFTFEKYNVTELMAVFDVMLKRFGEEMVDVKAREQCTKLLSEVSKKTLAKQNARFVENWIIQARSERDRTVMVGEGARERVIANPKLLSMLNAEHMTEALVKMHARQASTQQNEQSIEEWMNAEFAKIVGCQGIKDQLIEFRRKVQFDRLRRERGQNVQEQKYHMIFSGPPGTGKTMIAKLIARTMVRLQLIQSEKVTFVKNSQELIGQYVGHTAPKVDHVVEQAAGGVLFIDEAYSISEYGRGQNSFGQEAIDTIMKHLDPPSCVMIFAGYEEPMDRFLRMNQGLARRIPYRYRFVPYSMQEMIEILYIMIEKVRKQTMDKSLGPQLAQLLTTVNRKAREVGNGGMMENWVNFALLHRDSRLDLKQVETQPELLDTLTLEDFKNTVAQLNVHDDKGHNHAANRPTPPPGLGGHGGHGGQGPKPSTETKSLKLQGPPKTPPKTFKLKRPFKEYKSKELLDAVTNTFEEAFDFYDRDNNKMIDYNEVLAMINQRKATLSGNDASQNNFGRAMRLLNRLDTNGDGTVSKQEFIDFYIKRQAICETMDEWLGGAEDACRTNLGLPPKPKYAMAGGGSGPNRGPSHTASGAD